MSLRNGVLAVVLMLFAMSANADKTVWETYVMPSGEGALSISEQECTVPKAIEEWEGLRAMARVRFGEDVGLPKQSRLLWHGKVYAGCYVEYGGLVMNIDSLGEKLVPAIPRDMFKPHDEALPQGKDQEV